MFIHSILLQGLAASNDQQPGAKARYVWERVKEEEEEEEKRMKSGPSPSSPFPLVKIVPS
jgi:hypothetical protein